MRSSTIRPSSRPKKRVRGAEAEALHPHPLGGELRSVDVEDSEPPLLSVEDVSAVDSALSEAEDVSGSVDSVTVSWVVSEPLPTSVLLPS